MEKLRAGVIGIGFIGAVHIEAIRRLGYVDVVALTSTTEARKKADQLSVEHAFDNYRDMIDSCKLDVVHICTPNDTHRDMAIYALEKGIHVICEKPFCTTLLEAKEMVEAAKRSGKVAALNFHNRFYPMADQMKQMIQDGDLGDIYTIHGGYIQDWLLYETDFSWRILKNKSGKTRALADIGSHWIDLAEYVTGKKVVEVLGEFDIYHKKRKMPLSSIQSFGIGKAEDAEYEEYEVETEDVVNMMLRFSDGVVGSAVISQVFAGAKNMLMMKIGGSRQSVSWNVEDCNNLYIGRKDDSNVVMTRDPGLLHINTKPLAAYPGGHGEGFSDAIKQNFGSIYSYILDRGKPCNFATFNDGIHSMEVHDKIYESAQRRCWVKL